MKPKRARKPQDATLRNVRAANKRFEELDKKIDDTQAWLIALANACWQMCGTYFAQDMAKDLSKTKKVRKR